MKDPKSPFEEGMRRATGLKPKIFDYLETNWFMFWYRVYKFFRYLLKGFDRWL